MAASLDYMRCSGVLCMRFTVYVYVHVPVICSKDLWRWPGLVKEAIEAVTPSSHSCVFFRSIDFMIFSLLAQNML